MAKRKGARIGKRAAKKATTIHHAAVPIKHDVSNVQTIFANHFAVQFEASFFRLLFFELQPPLIFTNQTDAQDAIDKVQSVEAKCVARVVIPPHLMQKVIEALVTTVQQSTDMASMTTVQDASLGGKFGLSMLVPK
jgi:hypothetical protein